MLDVVSIFLFVDICAVEVYLGSSVYHYSSNKCGNLMAHVHSTCITRSNLEGTQIIVLLSLLHPKAV